MTGEETNVSVLFVCMGNICRSPTAEGVFRKMVADAELSDRIRVDSAGTHAYHQGEPPDRRAFAAAERRGFDLSGLQARRVVEEDFERFDLILAMDRLNLATLMDRSEEDAHERLKLLLEYSEQKPKGDVPDPYYGGTSGFERVLDLVEEASERLLAAVKERHLPDVT